MQSRRQAYLVIKNDNKEIFDHKIRLLEQIGAKQRNQISRLMKQSTPRASAQHQERLIPQPLEADNKQNKPQTARKRYRCQDFVEKANRVKQVDWVENGKAKVESLQEDNYLWNVHKPQSKEEDKQLEYLKSEQYKNYLETVMQANSKQQKAKTIKECRNNNVYLGDRKQYIQSIIKSKQVLPRVQLQFTNTRSVFSYQKQEQTQPIRHHMRDNANLKRDFVQNRRDFLNQNKKVIPIEIKKQELQQSPIKSYPIFDATTSKEKVQIQPIVLQPVCQAQKKKPESPKYQPSKINNQYQNFRLNTVEEKISKVSRQSVTYGKGFIKNETYRKELEYCQRQNVTDRKMKKKNNINVYKYRVEEKADKENHRSFSSSLSHSSREDKNIYNVSFKIPHPNQLKQPMSFADRHYYNRQNKQRKQNKQDRQNRYIKPQQGSKCNEHWNITPKKYQERSKQRVHTAHNLQWSHTTVTTKEVDNCTNKSSSKMSVVSKSKLKR